MAALAELSNNSPLEIEGNDDGKERLLLLNNANNRNSSTSPQAENNDNFFVQSDDIHVEICQPSSINGSSAGSRVQSCQVDYSSSSNVTTVGSVVDGPGQKKQRKSRQKSRPISATVPPVMTTQTALVAELKDVLRRKSKFIEVVPDPHNLRTRSPNSDEAGEYDDDDEYDDDEVDEEEEELGHNGLILEASPEIARNRLSASPFSNSTVTSGATSGGATTADGCRSRTPQMPQMCRNVRCAIAGDECDQFFADCQTSGHTSRRTFEVLHDGALVNLQIVAVIGVDNRDELPRFRLGNQNVDVFLTVFKDEENLQKLWMPQIRRVNAEVPIVIAGGLASSDGHLLASQIGAVDYVDASSTGDVRALFETVVSAVLGPPRNSNIRNTSSQESASFSPHSSSDAGLIDETAAEHPPCSNLATSNNIKTDNSDDLQKLNKKKANKCCCTIS